jgi:hypothetical protein
LSRKRVARDRRVQATGPWCHGTVEPHPPLIISSQGDTNLTQREIDLAYGLKDKQARIYSPNKYIIIILKGVIISICYGYLGN